MVRRAISKGVIRIISAESTRNFHVIFSWISVLGIYVLFLLLDTAEKMDQTGCLCRNLVAMADGSFRTYLLSKICVDFMVCIAGNDSRNKMR